MKKGDEFENGLIIFSRMSLDWVEKSKTRVHITTNSLFHFRPYTYPACACFFIYKMTDLHYSFSPINFFVF